MKKIFSIILIAVISLTLLCACGSNDLESRVSELETRVAALDGKNPSTPQSEKNNDSKKESQEDTSSAMNVISFEIISADTESYKNAAIYTIKATNNGNENIIYSSFDIAFYDKDGTCIETDGRYNDVLIAPGKSVNIKSYGGDESTKNTITEAKVTSYYYILQEPNENGNNKIDVNCETGKTKESYSDNY